MPHDDEHRGRSDAAVTAPAGPPRLRGPLGEPAEQVDRLCRTSLVLDDRLRPGDVVGVEQVPATRRLDDTRERPRGRSDHEHPAAPAQLGAGAAQVRHRPLVDVPHVSAVDGEPHATRREGVVEASSELGAPLAVQDLAQAEMTLA